MIYLHNMPFTAEGYTRSIYQKGRPRSRSLYGGTKELRNKKEKCLGTGNVHMPMTIISNLLCLHKINDEQYQAATLYESIAVQSQNAMFMNKSSSIIKSIEQSCHNTKMYRNLTIKQSAQIARWMRMRSIVYSYNAEYEKITYKVIIENKLRNELLDTPSITLEILKNTLDYIYTHAHIF